MEGMPKLTSIFIYPIKSCRGISVSQAPLTPTGLRWDRNWLVEPKLALVEVMLPTEAFLEGWEPTKDSYLVLKAPGMDVLKVSLSKQPQKTDGISVWEWSGSALDEGDEASNWFSKYLGKPSRLVRFNTASETRPVEPGYADGHNVMFSDMYPFMMISQGSLDALNEQLKEPVSINRFRPKTREQRSKSTSSIFRVSNYAPVVPTINQENGIAGPEPNETLKKIRSDQVLRPTKKQQGKIYFGQNLVWKDCRSGGKGDIVKVGDPVCVLQKVSSAAEAAA